VGLRDRRQCILDASARLFRHYGAQKTTMGEIAREAKIAVGSLYLEFESKEDIVHELSKDVHARILEEMQRLAAKHADAPSAALVAALEARTLAFLECKSDGPHGCELAHCTADGVAQAKALFAAKEEALLAEILERGIKAQVFRKGSSKEIAALCLRAFASLSPPAIWMQDAKDARKAARELAALLVRGLEA
jgi:AcrR family transcriptional regulator